tara:strand:+ start:194 stop:1429 length:1236 start_codon:yes stop_codon:yes gene_type:complete
MTPLKNHKLNYNLLTSFFKIEVYILILLFIFSSCSTTKKIKNDIASGNYDKAITETISKIKTIKNKKKKDDYFLILNETYYKAIDNDLSKIDHLINDGNPELYKDIYQTYLLLNERQNKIKPIIPLKSDNKKINFNFFNYDSQIIDYRYKTSDYLYNAAKNLMKNNLKSNYKEAYYLLTYIEEINPNFNKTRNLIQECIDKGKHNILVEIFNDSDKIISEKLENDILDFETYGLKSLWQSFYSNRTRLAINYDYKISLIFKNIEFSPEIMNEKEKNVEKRIKDGLKYLLDDNGNVVKDSLGNDIKIDNIITVRAKTIEFRQTKAAKIIAQVQIVNLKTNELVDKFPLSSEFIFENIFIEFSGDRRTLNSRQRRLSKNKFLPYPSNEFLTYNNSNTIKSKLKYIVSNYAFSE